MSCNISGHVEESDIHTLLECPIASQIWQGNDLDELLRTTKYRTLADCVNQAKHLLDSDGLGDFFAVLWDCWNARNRLIFNKIDGNLHTLAK